MFKILNELPAFKNWEICMKILESWMIGQHWSFLHDSSHLAVWMGSAFSSSQSTPFLMSSGCERQMSGAICHCICAVDFLVWENYFSGHNLIARSFWFLGGACVYEHGCIVGNTTWWNDTKPRNSCIHLSKRENGNTILYDPAVPAASLRPFLPPSTLHLETRVCCFREREATGIKKKKQIKWKCKRWGIFFIPFVLFG